MNCKRCSSGTVAGYSRHWHKKVSLCLVCGWAAFLDYNLGRLYVIWPGRVFGQRRQLCRL